MPWLRNGHATGFLPYTEVRVGSFNQPALNFRQLLLPPLLGLAVFAVASFSMRFPHWTDQTSSLWLATGVSLAALLRTSRREWPLLIAASILGTLAASFYAMYEPWYVGVSRAANNALNIACAPGPCAGNADHIST
jgi:integral membrane sensor domain MASE1